MRKKGKFLLHQIIFESISHIKRLMSGLTGATLHSASLMHRQVII